ncbi:putative gluconokinase isoform X2 [Canis aureus]
MAAPDVLLVMGVSGSGKSTVGALLASELGWKFYDADDYHPEENRTKMGKGIPLNDQAFQPPAQTRIHPKARKIITSSNPAFWKFPIHLNQGQDQIPKRLQMPHSSIFGAVPTLLPPPEPLGPFQSFLLPCSSPQGLCIYFPTIWNTLLSPLLLTPLLYTHSSAPMPLLQGSPPGPTE